jgi:hypothetical protein
MSYKRFCLFIVDFHHQRFSSFKFRQNFLLFRLRDKFSTRVLRFFSFVKAFFLYCDCICIDVCLCFEYVAVDSLQLLVYVHQLLLNVAVFDEQQKSSSSTILSMRKVVKLLTVSKFFSFSNLSMSFCICCLRSCKLIRDAMKNDLETSSRRSVDVDMIDTRLSFSQCLDR